MRGIAMGSRKNPQETEIPPEELSAFVEIDEEGGFKANMKLREEFKQKLDDIGKALGVAPGAIIEGRLRRFVEAQWPIALRRLQEQAAAKLRQAQSGTPSTDK